MIKYMQIVTRNPARLSGNFASALVYAALITFLVINLTAPLQAADSKATASPPVTGITWTQTSQNGKFEVTLDAQTAGPIAINEFLEWTVTVKTPDGEAVTPARITVDGGMPMHGHGLPTQPQVGEYLGDGKYLIKGLKFSMNGRWSIDLDIQSKSIRDQVKFELVVDY